MKGSGKHLYQTSLISLASAGVAKSNFKFGLWPRVGSDAVAISKRNQKLKRRLLKLKKVNSKLLRREDRIKGKAGSRPL